MRIRGVQPTGKLNLSVADVPTPGKLNPSDASDVRQSRSLDYWFAYFSILALHSLISSGTMNLSDLESGIHSD